MISHLVVSSFAAIAGISVALAESPTWPDCTPCKPDNRFTVEGAIPVVNMLYKGQYNELHSGAKKDYDLVTVGDSITCNWNIRDKEGYYVLSPKGYLGGVFNFGIGGDRIEQVIWRLEEGGLMENFTTKYFTLLIGTNNSYQRRMEQNVACDKPEEMAKGIERILWNLKTKHPEAKILLMPILPYDMKGDPRAVECRANNEMVNDLIMDFIDNKRVFWLDLRGGFLNADGSFKDEYWSASGEPGSDGKGHYLHPAGKGYKEVFDPAVAAAMKKYAAVPAGTAQETDPSLGYASVGVDGVKAEATVTLHGVYRGTDASAVAAKSYSVAYRLDGGDWKAALKAQTLPRNTFVISDVAVGRHTCEIRIVTSAKKTVDVIAEFTMCEAWSAVKLSGMASSVRTDGELVYAYALRDCAPNGVKFAKLTANENDDISWGLIFGFTSQHPTPEGTEKGAYSDLLGAGWWIPGQTGGKKVPLTLKKLTPGKKYLVQILAYRSACNAGTVWIDGTQKDTTFIKAGSDGWPFGGSLECVFTADAESKTIDIMIEGQSALNAVQLRKL